ncbi:Neuronal acetylcholine receptor subunit beta-3 [Echinococcus granulosus]|uniref:Neuronal acetylcholine receptor subunit alpha 4 n=1 Tax=Echinococcus granulosus TaxID=6210 RepID=A0A068WGX3_ECHGR|nr:Neuronal acetylcholine receptor subunit beta-3 [Echinococcus granulosus]CDS19330.1 neuronal acetylcholine receptor subunit alpha 4 [Echinococcus granulosus]
MRHHPVLLCLLVILLAGHGLLGPAPKGHPKINKTKSVEKALIRMLIERYRRYGVIGRPVSDSKTVLKVRYGLQLIQILDLDENKQILHTNCWSMYKWNDSLLQWNPAEHGNVTEVRIFPSQVWTPDIQLFNFADERIQEHRIARVVVHSDGSILWVPQALFKSTCQVEITYFPFDTQICTLEFGSWTYDRTQLELDWWVSSSSPIPMAYVDFVDYVPSNEWRTDGEEEKDIVHTNRTKQIKAYKRYQERNQTDGDVVTTKQYTVLCYRVRLHRNPSFYIFILVVPCILLSSLTIVVFWLPPESPAKMMLGMNIFVTFFLLLLVLAGQTPNAVKEFPLIGAYFCLNMIMITLSTFLATLVIHFHYRGARNGPLPAILHRVIIEGMGRLMMVRQSIPLPEEKKTLSHVVTRTGAGGLSGRSSRRRKVRVPELPSNKFLEDDDDDDDHIINTNTTTNNESPRCPPFGPTTNCIDGGGGWKNQMSGAGNRAAYSVSGAHATCPGCMGLGDSVEDLSRRSGGTSGPLDWQASATEPLRGEPAANLDSEDSPIMLSSSTSLERDVRELKHYVRMFVTRQKEGARKNAIAMEWRTMALVLDRLFFFVYIATIGITVVTSLPRSKRLEGSN